MKLTVNGLLRARMTEDVHGSTKKVETKTYVSGLVPDQSQLDQLLTPARIGKTFYLSVMRNIRPRVHAMEGKVRVAADHSGAVI